MDEIEKAIIAALLDGDHPTLAVLRQQASLASVTDRDFSPVGRNVYFATPAATPKTSPASFDLSDVAFQFQDAENSGHAVLMVRGGYLHELMVYNWTDDWPQKPVLAWVKYLVAPRPGAEMHPADARDFRALAKELAAA